MRALEIAFVFALGAAIGSFLNVCVWRLATDRSLFWPGSHCPKCLRPIRWFDNIPILSYLILRARCRTCGSSISIRYPLVEFFTALAFVGLYWLDIVVRGGRDPDYALLVVHCYITASLIAGSLIDLDYKILPDEITKIGIVAGLAASALMPRLHGVGEVRLVGIGWLDGLGFAVIGALVGAGMTYGMGRLGTWLFKRDAMGFGDVKLMAMFGAFFGWDGAVLIFFMGPFFGLVIGGALAIKRKSREIPYGPFLSMAAIIVMLFKEDILTLLGRFSGAG